ncbi:ABC transporter ATP-binding protein [Candidatus Pelagibacter sp. Uisw_134_02]|uniref:ABC transporter ATP-binding protein n=1 Tax=Candidatus Pelagibacter sp. Uisw_134_02 TaxID=3230990 RepID=UPI0039ECD686
MFKIIKDLNSILNKKQKLYLIFIYFSAFIVSLLEVASIGSLVGFITMLSNPIFLIEKIPLETLRLILLSMDKSAIAIYASVTLVVIFLFKNIFLFLFYYAESHINKNLTVDFCKNVLRSILNKPYIFHTLNNPANSITSSTAIVRRSMTYIFSNLVLFREVLTMLFLMTTLLFFNAKLSIITFALLIFFTLLFYFFIKEKMKILGAKANRYEENILRYLKETFSSIKLIKLSNKNEFWIKRFFIQNNRLYSAHVISYLIGRSPKIILELFSVTTIVIIFMSFVLAGKQIEDVLPILTLIVLIVIRSIPGFININLSINNINYNHKAIIETLSILIEDKNKKRLNQNLIPNKEILELNNIELKNISYSYNDNAKIFDNVSFKISKGEIVGISGVTGSGKSTLVDIILGLLKVNKGEVLINNTKINENTFNNLRIGYVPQDTYLSDESIAANIAFSLESDDIDFDEIQRVLHEASLTEFVNGLPDKENTLIGEAGVRLSGGQKQRLGLARALYNNPSLLILDEATSSLDYKTEEKIIKEIIKLKKNKIIIMIAHRVNTLENCDKIFTVKDGKVS